MVGLGKLGQYKIQQMAFMILAIFFFFALVGLFFVGWQFNNIQKNVAQLQEEKALSALKVIADSTELHCDQSEDFCIDRDKLIAFSEHSELYDGYWSVASIELLTVYPQKGERRLSFFDDSSSSEGGGTLEEVSCQSDIDHSGDGNPDFYVLGTSNNFNLDGQQGRLDHQSSDATGNAKDPLLVYDSLTPGDQIKVENIVGTIVFNPVEGISAACDKSSLAGGYGGVVLGFYTSSGVKILERALVDFSLNDGVEVPQNAELLYAYVIESDEFRFNYLDNVGTCSFSIGVAEIEECPLTGSGSSSSFDSSFDDSSGISDFSGSSGSFDFSTSGSDPVLCPAPNCDYYVLYDSGQVNKQTYSAYVTVCEKVDRSHEICELAKLILGVEINDDS